MIRCSLPRVPLSFHTYKYVRLIFRAPNQKSFVTTRKMINEEETLGSKTLKSLREYYNKGETKKYEWRIKQLKQLRKMLLENRAKWEEALEKDLKQTLFLKKHEVDSVVQEIDYLTSNLRNLMKPEKIPITNISLMPATGYIYREPYGVVLIISPWNYPISLLLRPLAGAFAGGNVSVIKPSEVSAACSSLFAELVPKYFDKNIVTVVEGAVKETTDLLNQPFDFIFYTGSPQVGKIVMTAAAKHLTPCILELGGKSPVIVDKNVSLDVAVRRIVWGKLLNVGQSCIAPDYIYVHKDIEKDFIEKAKETIQQFFGEDAQKSSDYSRIISERHILRLKNLLDKTNREDIVYGGKIDVKDRYIEPTIIVNTRPDSPIMSEEIFGPIMPIITYTNVEEAFEYINSQPKPLALYVFSSDRAFQKKVLSSTSSGTAAINDTMLQYTCSDLPFGGCGYSGIGKYHGKATFEAFTHPKSVLDKSVYLDAPIRYPPYTESKVNLINMLDYSIPVKKMLMVFIPIAVACLYLYFGKQ